MRLLKLSLWVMTSVASLAGSWLHAAEPATSPLVVEARDGIIGMQAPAQRLTTIDGDVIDLGALYGNKAVYIKFWATWCIPCREQMPHFESVYQTAGDDLAVIALNAGFNDTLEDILDYRAELGIHMPIVVDDGTMAGTFNLRITPQHVVIGKDGKVKHIGNLADAELDAVLERERNAPAVAGAAIAKAVAATPQLGPGALLPTVALQTASGDLTLSAAAPGGSVFVFMIPWCESYLATSRPAQAAACKQVREQIEQLQAKHPEIRWQGVSSGIWTLPGDLQAYSREYNAKLPLALDANGELFRRFKVLTVPTVIVADPAGKIVGRMEGYQAALEQAVATLHQ